MKEIKINNIEFFEDYQEVKFSIYENDKLIEQNVAITQLPNSPESIHTIDDKDTTLASVVAELAEESDTWKDYDSDESRILRAIDRHTLTKIFNEFYTLNACFENNVTLEAFITEYKELVIVAIDNQDRQFEIQYKIFDTVKEYEDFLNLVRQKHNLSVGSCSSAYLLATELGFTKDSEKEATKTTI